MPILSLTALQDEAWIINFVGAGFVGFGIGGMGDIVLTYLQDSYLEVSHPFRDLESCLTSTVASSRNPR